MRVHLHGVRKDCDRTVHYDHKEVKEIFIADGAVKIVHLDPNVGYYEYCLDDFRAIRVSRYD